MVFGRQLIYNNCEAKMNKILKKFKMERCLVYEKANKNWFKCWLLKIKLRMMKDVI